MKSYIQEECLRLKCPETTGASIYPEHGKGLVEIHIFTKEELNKERQEIWDAAIEEGFKRELAEWRERKVSPLSLDDFIKAKGM